MIMNNFINNSTLKDIEQKNLNLFLKTEFIPYFIGIHISGPNVSKTSIVILNGQPNKIPLTIYGLYEKIGSVGKLFSDDRILDILSIQKFYKFICVDSPLSVPPCVNCKLSICPGILNCENINVAYMLRLNEKLKKEFRLRKKRPINPQTQRISDIIYQLYIKTLINTKSPKILSLFTEPSYNSNLIPLITRATILQKRLNYLSPQYTLIETSIPWALLQIANFYNLSLQHLEHYKNFEHGKNYRFKFLEVLIKNHWINISMKDRKNICYSIENFNAFIASLTCAFCALGLFKNIIADHTLKSWQQIFIPAFHYELNFNRKYLN